jgi:hypothetical protein
MCQEYAGRSRCYYILALGCGAETEGGIGRGPAGPRHLLQEPNHSGDNAIKAGLNLYDLARQECKAMATT